MMPAATRATDLIERRVLAEVERELREDEDLAGDSRRRRRRAPRRARPPAPPPVRTVSDEIGRLRELRDSGALTDEQYAKAVDRAIAGEA
jgi:hypothetical protein